MAEVEQINSSYFVWVIFIIFMQPRVYLNMVLVRILDAKRKKATAVGPFVIRRSNYGNHFFIGSSNFNRSNGIYFVPRIFIFRSTTICRADDK